MRRGGGGGRGAAGGERRRQGVQRQQGCGATFLEAADSARSLNDGMSLAVYDTSRHEHVPVARLGLPGPSPRPPPGSIVECSKGIKGSKGTWDVVDVRRDKTTANDMLTYPKTQVNIKEAISYADLTRVMRIGV